MQHFTVIACLGALGVPWTAHANQGAYQTANVVAFPTGTPVSGAATMFRSKQAIEVRIATSGLDANAAYTVWWIIFNNPAGCVGGCGEDDLGNPNARASVFYAVGFVTGNDGTANVAANLKTGALPAGLDVLLGSGLEPGKGLRAEIHLVVRSHGPIVPGMVAQQISTFDPACTVCADQQAVVFPPVQ